MTELSRRAFLSVLAAAAPLTLVACGGNGASSVEASASTSAASPQAASSAAATAADEIAAEALAGKHVIGVAVYDVSDNEVMMFYQYLVDYIAKVCFDDVRFVYSNSITSEDELISFIDDVAAMGGEGIMSFYNIDLEAEVVRCADHGMYHIVASGTVSDEDFAKVEDNEYFLGAIGPMIQMEYTAGANMVTNFIANKAGDRYFILSGGAGVGNEMHYQRTLGMLDTLKSSYGVSFGDTKELAATAEPVTIETEKVTVTIGPGYLTIPDMRASVIETLSDGSGYDVVLSTIPVEPVYDLIRGAGLKVAMVDCYSQDNQLMFASGHLDYLVGKYGSLVGPSFAAMYNAITGHASAFRDNGKAFKIVQNFWTSSSEEDFDKKYELASNMTLPAFNYEDLYSVCCAYTPDATFEDLRELAEKCSYDDAKARRSL